MIGLGPELDTARARVVERGLTADAAGQLLQVVSGLSLDELGTVKQLLKRFFSEQPWTAADDEALADAVATDPGAGRHELEPGLTVVWGSEGERFRLRVESAAIDASRPPPVPAPDAADETDLGTTFDGVVVPEATPSPRTIRFATPPLHSGPGRTYDSAASAAADAPVARLFAAFEEVTNVLVGPDFVAVTLARPGLWEHLLASVLRTVTDEFTAPVRDSPPERETEAPMTLTLSTGSDDAEREPRRLERAWAELGALRADRPEHLDRVLQAARDAEPARRQVAAALLTDAPAEVAARSWDRLLNDRSRAVRRSTVDAVGGAGREELRPLLERALDDADAWTRWKALHGIAELAVGSSRAAVEARATDPDFRVRLEAARILTADRSD